MEDVQIKLLEPSAYHKQRLQGLVSAEILSCVFTGDISTAVVTVANKPQSPHGFDRRIIVRPGGCRLQSRLDKSRTEYKV